MKLTANMKIISILFFLLLTVILIYIKTFYWKPNISFNPHITQNQLVFGFDCSQINGMLDLKVYDKNKVLVWNINLNYFCKDSLIFGVIPQRFSIKNGKINSAKQIFPDNNQAPLMPTVGETIYVIFTVQYDTLLTPAVTSRSFSFSMISNGDIISLKELEREVFSE